jgi:hypothetical protein
LNYYVYYKVAPERVPELRRLVEQLFALIEKQAGVRGQWLRRPDESGTYMEVYEGITDQKAFEALLEREGAKLGVQRKVERFQCA